MKHLIILNPYANRWRARNGEASVRAALDAAEIHYEIYATKGPGDAVEQARCAADNGFGAVIAGGGDGTVHEVVNGLIQASGSDDNAPTLPLGILPLGNGNDFNDMLGLPRDPVKIAAILAEGRTRYIDAGKINDVYFDNNCAAAMEPLVTLESSKLNKVTGNLRYILGLLRALVKLKAWNMKIEWENGQYDGPTHLLSVCNGRRVGKLFMMAPYAEFDDGLFDVVFVPRLSRWQVLIFLTRLMRAKHLEYPGVQYFRTSWIRFTSQPGTPIHADGEMLAESWYDGDVRLLPKKLQVFCQD